MLRDLRVVPVRIGVVFEIWPECRLDACSQLLITRSSGQLQNAISGADVLVAQTAHLVGQ